MRSEERKQEKCRRRAEELREHEGLSRGEEPGCWFSLALTVCIVWFGCCCLLYLISLLYLLESRLLLWIGLNHFASPVSNISTLCRYPAYHHDKSFMFIPAALHFSSNSPCSCLNQYSFCFLGATWHWAEDECWSLVWHMGRGVNS